MTDHENGGHPEDSPGTVDVDGFDTLGLRPELLKTIVDLGYEEPTPIQRETIPTYSPAETCSDRQRLAPERLRRSRCQCCR